MRWFTSDHHFGHVRIIELCDRPFADVDEMNAAMVERWNARVGADDTVYVLGDFAMGRIADTLPLVSKLSGRKILIPGNHDRCWAGEKRAHRRQEWTARYLAAGFDNIYTHDRPLPLILSDNTPVLLWHFPYRSQETLDTEGDYMGRVELDSLHPTDRGTWLLHGHVHTEWCLSDRQINVGVDTSDILTRGAGFEPISEDEIIDAMRRVVVA